MSYENVPLFPADTAAVQLSVFLDPSDGFVVRCAWRLADETGWNHPSLFECTRSMDPVDAFELGCKLLAEALQLP